MKLFPKKRKFFLGLLLFFFLAILVLSLILPSGYFKRLMIGGLDRYLQKRFQLSLRVEDFRYSLFQLSAELKGVRLQALSSEAPYLEQFSARRLFLDVAFSSVFSKDLHIQKLQILQPRLKLNLEGKQVAKADVQQKKAFRFRIDELDLTGGWLEYGGQNYAAEGALAGILGRIKYDGKARKHYGELKTQSGKIIFPSLTIPLDKLQAEFCFDSEEVEMMRLTVLSRSSLLEVSGGLKNYQLSPRYDLRVKSIFKLDEFQPVFYPKYAYGGSLEIEASVQGEQEKISFTGRLEGQNLAFNGHFLGDLQAEFRGDESMLSVSSISGFLAGGRLEGEMNLALVPGQESLLSLRWEEVSLKDLSQILPHFPSSLDSRSSGDLKMRWKRLDPAAITAASTILFSSPRPAREGLDTLDGRVIFKAERGEIAVSESYLKINQDTLTFSGMVDRKQNLEARFRLAVKDLSSTEKSVLQLMERLKGFPLSPELNLGGKARVSGNVSGSLKSPRADLNYEGTGLQLKGVSIKSFKGSAGYARQKLSLEKLEVELERGRIKCKGDLDLKQRLYSLTMAAEDFELESIRSWASLQPEISGRISFELGGKGTWDEPEFTLRISGENLKAGPVELQRLDLEADSDGKAIQSVLRIPEGKMSLEAEIPFEEPRVIQGEFLISGISATASVPLPVARPEDMAVTLRIERVFFGSQELWLENRLPIIISVESGRLEVQELSLLGAGAEFNLAGILPFRAGDQQPGQVSLNSSVPLKLLQPFLAGSRLGGLFSLQGLVSGSLEQPVIKAGLELKGASFDYPGNPFDLRDISFSAAIDGHSFQLKNLEAGIGGGRVQARGAMPLSSLPFDFPGPAGSETFSAGSNFEIFFKNISTRMLSPYLKSQLAEDFEAILSGRVHFGGSFKEISRVEMRGELEDLRISLPPLSLANQAKIAFHLGNGLFSLDEFRLSGEKASFEAAGKLHLVPEPSLDARLSAKMDSALLAPLVKDAVLGGVASLDLILQGALANPVFKGRGEVKGGLFQLPGYALSAGDIKGALEFSESAISLTNLQGILNGGPFEASGRIDLQGLKFHSGNFDLSANNVQLSFPEGLSGRVRSSLSLKGEGGRWLLSGEVKILQAFYGRDVYPGTQFLSAIRSHQFRSRIEKPEILKKLRLDVRASTVDPALIDNNLASLELVGDVRLLGTAFNPLLTGRVSNRHSGEIILGKNRFQVEKARVDFLGREAIDPSLYVVGRTSLTHEYDELEITLTLSGPLSDLDYSLRSSPPRSQEELASLLLTGYGLNRIRDQSTNILGDQLLLYFASPLASPVTETLKRILKAEEVNIEPINIATEADPGARFTFRKKVTGQADIVYSIDVSNSQHQTWMLDYSLSRNFVVRSFRRDDGSYGTSFRHRFGFDLKRESLKDETRAEKAELLLSRVEFEGDMVFTHKTVKEKVKTMKKGSRFSSHTLWQAVENLSDFYKQEGFLNVVIEPGIQYEGQSNVNLTLRISPGEPASIIWRGDPVSKSLKEKVIGSWNGRIPLELAVANARDLILDDLHNQGFHEAEAMTERRKEGERKIVAFSVKKGIRYRLRKFLVEGNLDLDSGQIKKAVRDAPGLRGKGLWALLYDSNRAREKVSALYQEHGFLSAEIGRPKITLDRRGRFIAVLLPVKEGPRSRVRSVEFAGNDAFSRVSLREDLELVEGRVFRPSLLSGDRNRLLNIYRSQGYQDAEVEVEVIQEAEDPSVSISYIIKEGSQHTVSEIQIRGNRRTPDFFIQRELRVKAGDVLDLAALASSQKGLYDTGIFRSVNIYSEPLTPESSQERVVVDLGEEQMFTAAYGLRYNSEEKFEGFGELVLNNLFGRGRRGVLYYKQSSRIKDFRFSLKEPYLLGKKLNTLYSFSYNQEARTSFTTDSLGFSLQQRLDLPYDFSLSYLYRLSWIHTYELEPIGPFPFDITLFLSEVSAFLIRDSRDNKMDSQSGSFFSLSLTYSPEFLGSDLTYVSLFCQYSIYKTVAPGFVWASNYRLGLADAFDQVLIPHKRFYAGGGHTLRGFKQDYVGPLDPFLGAPEGGEALWVLNQELRFPLYKGLSGVAFYDSGNVYRELSEFAPFDLRHSLGLGVRLETPVGLLRFDYGYNLFRRQGEPRAVVFFSLGQAF